MRRGSSGQGVWASQIAVGRRADPWGIIEPVPHDAPETRSLRTLGLLLRGALHEISNPLVGLVGSAEWPSTKPSRDEAAPADRADAPDGHRDRRIVRALQAFVRLQDSPPGPLSLGERRSRQSRSSTRVLPTHGVTLTASGDATVVAAAGDVSCSLVELLVDASTAATRGAITLTVRSEGRDAVVTATGGGELRLPAAEAAT